MAIAEWSPPKYARLLATAQPRVIETREEFDRAVSLMEQLDRREASGKPLSPEEGALRALLEQLVKTYDGQIELPSVPPLKILLFLMAQRGLRQADLVPVFGSRSVVSDVVTGKREFSKAHIRRLAEFFHLSPEVFL